MTTTIAETYDFFTVTNAQKNIGLEQDTEVFALGIRRTPVGYLAVVYLNVLSYEGYTEDFTSYLEEELKKNCIKNYPSIFLTQR